MLRRLVADPDALARVAGKHWRSPTSTPTPGPISATPPGPRERCERACYDCLLSYGNQFEHALIDRHAIRDLLLEPGCGCDDRRGRRPHPRRAARAA